MQQQLAELTAKLETSQEKPRENALEANPREPLAPSITENRQHEGETVPSHPKPSNKIAPQNYGAIPPIPDEGIDQTSLCNFYGMKSVNLTRDCRAAGFSDVADYFVQMTGVRWQYRGNAGMKKLYFPIEPLQND
jgi:hypothetical protein